MTSSATAVRQAQAARHHSRELRARLEWNRRRVERQRQRCRETLARSIVTLAERGKGPLWDLFELGDLDEIEDVAPPLRLVPDPD